MVFIEIRGDPMRNILRMLLIMSLAIQAPASAVNPKKRKLNQIVAPTATIRWILNQTQGPVTIQLIDNNTNRSVYRTIEPGNYLLNENIPLFTDDNAEYDLLRIGDLPENVQPEEQLFLRMSREVEFQTTHENNVRIKLSLGILDWSTQPPTEVATLQAIVGEYTLYAHQFDHYTMDILLRGHDFAGSRMHVGFEIVEE